VGWSDVGLLLIRLVIGGTLIMHGWNHWRGGGKIGGTARWFEGLGLRPGIAAHRRNGFFVFRDGYEYVLMIAVVATALAALGPGRASLDHAAGINFAGTAGVLTALIAGVGGAAWLLAASWRPASVKQAAEPAAAPVAAVSQD
jgi:putative oxidoreductase